MPFFYSPAERGFFCDAIHKTLPDDAQPITEQLRDELVQAQSQGMEIVPGPTGQPISRKPVVTAEQLRPQLHQTLNNERVRRERAGFHYRDKRIDADPASVERITSAVLAAMSAKTLGTPLAMRWTCADNSELELDAEGVMGMPVALAKRNQALHDYCQVKKAEIDRADLPALKVMDLREGWPA